MNGLGPHGRRTEVHAASVPNWRKIMFQMLSKGSTTLLHGIVSVAKCRGRTGNGGTVNRLNRIDEYELRDVILGSATQTERKRLAANIIHGLETIHAQVFNTSAHDLGLFSMNASSLSRSEQPGLIWTHAPSLHPLENRSRYLLPEAKVLRTLLPRTSWRGLFPKDY